MIIFALSNFLGIQDDQEKGCWREDINEKKHSALLPLDNFNQGMNLHQRSNRSTACEEIRA